MKNFIKFIKKNTKITGKNVDNTWTISVNGFD